MISLKTQKENLEGKTMYTIEAEAKCNEKGCTNCCKVKLQTQATSDGIVWQVVPSSIPAGWIASIRAVTCSSCVQTRSAVLIFDDFNNEEVDPAKVAYLAELQNKIAALKAKRSNMHGLMTSPTVASAQAQFDPGTMKSIENYVAHNPMNLSQLDTPFPPIQSQQ